MTIADFSYQPTARPMTNSFDSKIILEGIRHWVEMETPTEAPDQVNRLATLVADGYRDPVALAPLLETWRQRRQEALLQW